MPQTRVCVGCGSELSPDASEEVCPVCQGLASSSSSELDSPSTGPYQSRVEAPAPAELARFFPHLEIVRLLGQGGMGAVYQARQPKLDRMVALKVLPPESNQDSRFADRFLREARTLARLDHPNIVGIHDFGETGRLCYFLMDYVAGMNLRQTMRAGPMVQERMLGIVFQICDALQYAHHEGIVHRDIKPENILIDKRGRVKIADFGLAKLLGITVGGSGLTGSRQVMGTLHYMAPEQWEKPQTVDHRADIYSLGVMMYEMMTGELPLGRFAPPSQLVTIDQRFDEIIMRALEKNPERRFQNINEIKRDLGSICAQVRLEPMSLAQEMVGNRDETPLPESKEQVQPEKRSSDATESMHSTAAVPDSWKLRFPPLIGWPIFLCLLGSAVGFLPWELDAQLLWLSGYRTSWLSGYQMPLAMAANGHFLFLGLVLFLSSFVSDVRRPSHGEAVFVVTILYAASLVFVGLIHFSEGRSRFWQIIALIGAASGLTPLALALVFRTSDLHRIWRLLLIISVSSGILVFVSLYLSEPRGQTPAPYVSWILGASLFVYGVRKCVKTTASSGQTAP
jgi:serine/threonine protein kinase